MHQQVRVKKTYKNRYRALVRQVVTPSVTITWSQFIMLSVARNEKLGNNIHNKGKHFNGQISTDIFIQHQQKPEKTVTEQNFKTIVTVYALLHVIVFNDAMSEL